MDDLEKFIDGCIAHVGGFTGIDELKRHAKYELARLRAERDELRAAAKVVLSGFPENRDGMDYSGPLPVGIKRLRAALSRTEGGGK